MKRDQRNHPPCKQLRAWPSEGSFRGFPLGSISPFTSVVFHRLATPFDRVPVKSGQQRRRVVGVVIVVAAAGVDIAEVIVVVVIRGTEPPPHRCPDSGVL